MQFLKFTLASLLALFLFSLFSFLILIGIAASVGSSSQPTSLEEESLLKISFDERIKEQSADDPFGEMNFPFASFDEGMGLVDIKKSIRNAAIDPNILGIYMNFSGFPGGMAKAYEIRMELEKFKESGKPILFYGDFLSENGFYLASVADTVLINPSAIIELNGANSEFAFFKGTLEKLEIKPEVFKVGKYKSAVEPFLREDLSEENREQTEEILNSVYGHYLKEVAKSRGMGVEKLSEISALMQAKTPEEARELGLIDGIAYRDESYDAIKKMVGYSTDDKIALVSLKKYGKLKSQIEEADTRDRIAIIIADGEIRDGKSEDGIVGSETLVKEIKRAKDNDKVKAVVLRVNSPGGGGMASDDIWREIELLKEKKPVVTSMSDLAASGGYYISMGTNYIFAEPNTITGSIGVFALLFDMTDFFKNKLGITRDNVKTGEYSDIMSPLKPMTEEERAIVQSYANTFYQNFIEKAAKGRNTNPEAINEVGQGRVWTGEQAVGIGLVDELGSLDDAVEKAAELASLEEYRLRYYPKPKPMFERILEDFSGALVQSSLEEELGEYFPLYQKAEELKAKNGIWARLPMGWSINY